MCTREVVVVGIEEIDLVLPHLYPDYQSLFACKRDNCVYFVR